MCDYSLMALPNRLAMTGEELVVHRFDAGPIGLACEADVCQAQQILQSRPAGFVARLRWMLRPPAIRQFPSVCIPPGAHLLLRDIPPELQRSLHLESSVEEVVFTQLTLDVHFRDAVRFPNGTEILLQHLKEGQRMRVLSLSPEKLRLSAHEPDATCRS